MTQTELQEGQAGYRSPEEIEKLKADWMADGIWDIEETEGFEAYYDELKAFREQVEEKHEREYAERKEQELIDHMAETGISNRELAEIHLMMIRGKQKQTQSALNVIQHYFGVVMGGLDSDNIAELNYAVEELVDAASSGAIAGIIERGLING